MRDLKNTEIKTAQHLDIEDIIKICEENLLQNNREKFSATDFSSKGFLMGKITFDDVKEMIEDQENYLVLVAKNNGETLGYLTSCDISKMPEKYQEKVTN